MKQDRVRVYYNSTKHTLSVQRYINGKWRLSHHTEEINLCDVKFICSHATRLRTLKEGKKYVHAYFEGIESDQEIQLNKNPNTPYRGNLITYNPFKFPNYTGDSDEYGCPYYEYNGYCDQSVKDSFWDITEESPRKYCDYLSMRIIDKKPQMIAGIRL